MFAITGITGNVGGEVARNLLAAGRPSERWCETSAKAKLGQSAAAISWAQTSMTLRR